MGLKDIFRRSKAPAAAAARRAQSPRSRSFAGAENSRLLFGWTNVPQPPDEVLREQLGPLVARSRDSYQNNDFVRRYVDLVRSNVVGPQGIVLQASCIGRGGLLDGPANKAIEEAFDDWGRAENCDPEGRLSWLEKQWQAANSAAIDGEILARIIRGNGAGKYGLQVQHLDTQLLDPTYFADAYGGNSIRMGIEFDAMRRPVAYHLRDYTRSDYGYLGGNGRHYIRVPAAEIIHAFLPGQVGQSRGYPWTAPAMLRLKMLDGYFEAALVAARAGASKMGFITSPDGASYTGDATDSDGATISEFEAGVLEQLPDGFGFTGFDPNYPHQQFPEFVKACLRSIACGLGVDYASLAGDLSDVNYSSTKFGAGEAREGWKSLQEWMARVYHRRIYEAWLDMALTMGMVTVAGKPLKMFLADKYRRVIWQGRRWSSTDPHRDVQANQSAVDAGFTTVSAVIRESGRDPDDVFAERAQELEKFQKLGLTEAEALQPVGAPAVTEDEDGNDE